MPMRKVIARGYYKKKVWEPGEEIEVPETFTAKWLEDAQAPVKRRRKKAEPEVAAPEVTEETESSDDDAS